MNTNRSLGLIVLCLGLFACDDGAKPAAGGSTSTAADKPTSAKTADAKPAAAVPSCEAVVDNIASLNPGSGASEKKLWGKMCDDMSGEERSCVAVAKDMAGMKACIKKDKKLK
jgi:hypothetical protein